jgi:hypothetical protein
VRAGAAAVGLALLLAGCGSAPGGLSWSGQPIVVRQPELPRDTIVSGKIVNKGDSDLQLDAADVRLVTAQGEAVESTARFAVGVSHQLYPPRDGPKEKDPDFLKRRLGEIATVEPGKTVPLVVAWRLAPGEAAPVKVELGGDAGSVALP